MSNTLDATEVIRMLGLVTEPHCRTAAMAADVIREQADRVKRLQEELARVALMADKVDK